MTTDERHAVYDARVQSMIADAKRQRVTIADLMRLIRTVERTPKRDAALMQVRDSAPPKPTYEWLKAHAIDLLNASRRPMPRDLPCGADDAFMEARSDQYRMARAIAAHLMGNLYGSATFLHYFEQREVGADVCPVCLSTRTGEDRAALVTDGRHWVDTAHVCHDCDTSYLIRFYFGPDLDE